MRKRGNGEGSVYQRKDGRWVAAVTVGGRRTWFYAATRQKVMLKLNGALHKLEQGMPVADSSQTVKRYLDSWLQSVRPSVRPRTYEAYELHVRRLLPLIGAYRLKALTPAIVERAYADLQAGGLSGRTVHHVHTALHTAMKGAVQWGLLSRNPTEAATPPKAQSREMQVLDEGEVRQLLQATRDDDLHALWRLLVTTGLRSGEALALTWGNVDLAQGKLSVNRSLQRQKGIGLTFVPPKTSKSRRVVYISSGTVEALREHRRRQLTQKLKVGEEWQDNDLVFRTKEGKPIEPTRLPHLLHPILKAAALPDIRVHDLRHTAATLLLKQGTHPKVVQELLGHSTIALTLDTYSHVTPAMHSQVASEMEALFG